MFDISRARIGDKDIDEVSILSEHLSFASESSFPSSSESTQQEALELDAAKNFFPSLELQRDLEHTEYAVAPQRRESELSCVSTDEEEEDSLSPPPPRPPLPAPSTLSFDLTPPEALVTEAGRVLTVECQVGGGGGVGGRRPSADVAWFRRSRMLEASDRVEAESLGRGRHRLTLYDLCTRDSGPFSCAAASKDGGEVWRTFAVIVNRKRRRLQQLETNAVFIIFVISLPASTETPCRPSLSSSVPDFSSVKENASVSFSVVAGGFPEPRVFFYRHMRRLGNNENVLITRRASPSSDDGGGGGSEWILTVRRATARDAGVYEARASNGQGTVARSWAIKVEIPRTTTAKVRGEEISIFRFINVWFDE